MKAWKIILNAGLALTVAFLSGARIVRGAVASSANYEISNLVLEGGGGRMGSDNYTHDISIAGIAVRNVAQSSVVNNWGYTAGLNNPPIAASDVFSHPFNTAVDILTGAMLGNDFDFDGDALRVLSTEASTQAGGSISIVRDTLHYNPPPNFNGLDHFNYVAIDAAGDTSESTVTIVIAPSVSDQVLNSLTFTKLSDGTYLLRLKSTPGKTEYHIESATDPRSDNWQLYYLAHAAADGIVQVIINPSQTTHLFFRALVI